MGRRFLLLVAVFFAFQASAAHALHPGHTGEAGMARNVGSASAAYAKTDHWLPMGDGVSLAATLYRPDGAPPQGGWPAVLVLHGLGQDRSVTNAVAEAHLAPNGYVVLTVDARGHGASGGQSSLVGPREVADYAAALQWLRLQPSVSDTRVGALGFSLGGGSVWKLLTAPGTRLAAAVPVTTWTSLYDALLPQGLAKSGLIAYFYNLLPPERWDPAVTTLRDDALQGRNDAAIRAFAAQRSVRADLGRIRTPVFMLQGRRDYAFDMQEALAAFGRLRGPKRMYLGDLGHAPSANPPAEQAYYFGQIRMWFDRFLKGQLNGIDRRPRIELAPDPWRSRTYQASQVPARRVLRLTFRGRRTIDGLGGKVVRTVAPTRRLNETFGHALVSVKASTPTGWSHVVAVLSAITPRGGEIVVSQGGVPTTTLRSTTRNLTIRLLSQATTIPRGSRFRLTLAGVSTAQNPSNLLYLTGPEATSRVSLGEAKVVVPVLRRPVSR
ncbi:MAG TPA: CocE/NonD family hydrolase [Gaiellaceae bacterium]|nr:CocE/NonD family hydrolase [Gaiellaceae bacterium]